MPAVVTRKTPAASNPAQAQPTVRPDQLTARDTAFDGRCSQFPPYTMRRVSAEASTTSIANRSATPPDTASLARSRPSLRGTVPRPAASAG